MKIKNKKGQMTFFIIIGFVILVITGFAFYVNQRSAGSQTRKEALESQEVTFDIASITNYVTACLRNTATKGINILGEQGGRIELYNEELSHLPSGGWFPHLVFEQGSKITNVSYGLMRVEAENYKCAGSAGDLWCDNTIEKVVSGDFIGGIYPWKDYPDLAQSSCSGNGCFGQVMFAGGSGNALMYKQLERYILENIENCTDFSVFTNRGVLIEKTGDLEVNVTTAKETVISILKYPLNVVDAKTKKQTKLENFYYDTNIRLQKLYDISNVLVEIDKDNATFDITQANFNEIDEDIEIIVINEHTPNVNLLYPTSEDNIVQLVDNFSKIPFVFQFARQNRYPVLKNISQPLQISQYIMINETYFEDLGVEGYDPDEENITIYYSSTDSELGMSGQLQNFERAINVKCGGPGDDGTFRMSVCVSDKHFANACTDLDQSRDWQEVKFEIIDC